MIYDMRTYELKPGVLQEYMAAVHEVALPVRLDAGVKLAGWYYPEIGDLNHVVHIWVYQDYEHMEKAKQQFRSDPRWLNDYLPRVKGMIRRQRNQIMKAADLMDCHLEERATGYFKN